MLLLFLPLAALADGMVIPTVAYPAKITIPDQRALICFSNGTERLVIETRFTGVGTNFAWVVPLPNQPVIEEATTGLFPTLQYLFRPQIIHNVPRYYLWILLPLGFIYFYRRFIKSIWNLCFIVYILGLLLFLFASLLPALKSASEGTASSISSQPVSILDRKLVGIFETTTIVSHDVKALQAWLSQNGFAVPTNAEPAIASYVKGGWVFVATKVRRDQPDNETSTPHPLSFTFKTDKPVYPMRLTGVDSQRLKVELYIFGSDCAEASHFKVERCTRPNYPEPPDPNDAWYHDWRHSSSEIPDIIHPLLRKWVVGSPVATKLTATLSRADMRKDVWINWTPYLEKRNRLFSRQGALTIALNWGTGLFAAGLLVVCLAAFSNETHKPKLPRRIKIVTVASIVLVGLFYLALPKTKAKVVNDYLGDIREHQRALQCVYANRGGRTIAETRADLGKLISTSSTNSLWNDDLKNFDNYLVGGQVREEDSPGNYTIRETNGQLEFVSYDAQGAEHIQTLVPW